MALARPNGLTIIGAFHPNNEDQAPPDTGTLVLLGPVDPDFTPVFHNSVEFSDDAPDPLDRWSTRVIGAMADAVNGQALFPFGGPPFRPFIGWMQRGGRIWSSPTGLLVGEQHGLWVSCRGAIALRDRLDLATSPTASPCDSCSTRPCLTACPVNAFESGSYDVPRCVAHVVSSAGEPCATTGCRIRHACPAGTGATADPERAAFHMAAFTRANRN